MKKIIYNKFDKKQIHTLPVVKFPGKIVVILDEKEAERAVDYLLAQPLIGVDTETRPSFHRGETHTVSLLQASSEKLCFLFRLHFLGDSPAVKRLLENTQVPMIGLSWHDDLAGLRRLYQFEPGRFIDLQNVVGDIGIEDLSLQKLYANVFGQHISKRQRLTNWDADVLNGKQKNYAAIDAWACIQLYQEIMRLKETGDYELIIIKEEENEEQETPTETA